MDIPEGPYCQSCAAPLKQIGAGTQKGGKTSDDYCQYCYKDGAFLEPKLTLAEMKIRVHDVLVKEMGVSEFQSYFVTETFLPGLKRWQ